MPVTPGSRPNRPAPPSQSQATPAAPQTAAPPTHVDPTTARLELAQALEALKSNSKKLETKLEKIETTSSINLQPAVETSFVPSSDVSPVDVKPAGFESSGISGDITTAIENKRYAKNSLLP